MVHFAALCTVLALISCATRLGPKTIPAARFDCRERIARSHIDQLLLNLVRLRYKDTPVFLDVGTVIAQYTLDAHLGVLPRLRVDGIPGNEPGLDLGGSYSEQPTNTNEPLSGAEFTRPLLIPISPQTIILLSQSGWSDERLLMYSVDSINGIENAPVASGPTPDRIPNNSRFRSLANALRELQLSGALDSIVVQEWNDSGAVLMIDKPEGGGPRPELLHRIRGILDPDDEIVTLRLARRSTHRARDEIVMTGRSLLGALLFLSHNVAPPQSHESRGLVTGAKGMENNGNGVVSGDLLRIRSDESQPRGPSSGSAIVTTGYSLTTLTSARRRHLIFLLTCSHSNRQAKRALMRCSRFRWVGRKRGRRADSFTRVSRLLLRGEKPRLQLIGEICCVEKRSAWIHKRCP